MSFVTYEPQGAVAYLIINRPEALNALNSQVLADLDAALDAIDLDAVLCLIVRGAGEKSFVAGADIAQMKGLTKAGGESFGKQGASSRPCPFPPSRRSAATHSAAAVSSP